MEEDTWGSLLKLWRRFVRFLLLGLLLTELRRFQHQIPYTPHWLQMKTGTGPLFPEKGSAIVRITEKEERHMWDYHASMEVSRCYPAPYATPTLPAWMVNSMLISFGLEEGQGCLWILQWELILKEMGEAVYFVDISIFDHFCPTDILPHNWVSRHSFPEKRLRFHPGSPRMEDLILPSLMDSVLGRTAGWAHLSLRLWTVFQLFDPDISFPLDFAPCGPNFLCLG